MLARTLTLAKTMAMTRKSAILICMHASEINYCAVTKIDTVIQSTYQSLHWTCVWWQCWKFQLCQKFHLKMDEVTPPLRCRYQFHDLLEQANKSIWNCLFQAKRKGQKACSEYNELSVWMSVFLTPYGCPDSIWFTFTWFSLNNKQRVKVHL